MDTSQQLQPVDRSKWLFCAWLVAAMALALGLRLYGLGDENYWLDELHSMANSAARRAEFESLPHGVIIESAPRSTQLDPNSTCLAVWRGMEVDSHPPLYFTLLLTWRRLLGDGEFFVRLLPTLFSVLSILPLALILREYRRPSSAVWVAGSLAVAFGNIHIAQENRPYSLGLLLVSVSYLAFVKLEVGWGRFERREKIVWMVIYGLAVYLAMMTHYFTGLALMGQAVVVALRVRGPLLRAWLTCVGLSAAVFALTWGRQMIGQVEFIASQDWLLERTPDHLLRTFLRFCDLPVRLLFSREPFQLNYLLSIVGAIALAAALIAVRRSRNGVAVVFAVWYLVPTLFFVAVDLSAGKQVLSHLRYSSVAIPGLIGLLVLAARELSRMGRWAAVAILAIVVLLTLELPAQSNPRSQKAAELVAANAKPGDLLIYDAIDWPPFWASRLYQTVSYYLPLYMPGEPSPFVLLRDRPDEALIAKIASYDRIIVVSPRTKIPNPIPSQFQISEQTGYIRDIGIIYVFEHTPGDG